MADMAARVTLNYLLDFYGPLLTEHRQEVMRLYCEEDLSQQEIAEQLNITRQGVFDTIAKSKRQLEGYEQKLGLVSRYQAQREGAAKCLQALDGIHPAPSEVPLLQEAIDTLARIIER